MPADRNARSPVSSRHAFALAFDLALRRDPLHSIVVPLLLHAPWLLALAFLPRLEETDRPGRVLLLNNLALLGDFAVQLVVGAMLRFRARSVFDREGSPAPAGACYAEGLRRVPWLLVTEVVRNMALVFAAFFLVLPAVFLGYRMSLATEAVVLDEPDTTGAFRRSFRLTRGRFERWLEMIAMSVVLGLAGIFLAVAACVAAGRAALGTVVPAAQLVIATMTPIIQYAWTFFYLRLVETEAGALPAGPADAGVGTPGREAAGEERTAVPAGASSLDPGDPPAPVRMD